MLFRCWESRPPGWIYPTSLPPKEPTERSRRLIDQLYVYLPAPPNYPLRYPKYHLIQTIRPLIEVHCGTVAQLGLKSINLVVTHDFPTATPFNFLDLSNCRAHPSRLSQNPVDPNRPHQGLIVLNGPLITPW